MSFFWINMIHFYKFFVFRFWISIFRKRTPNLKFISPKTLIFFVVKMYLIKPQVKYHEYAYKLNRTLRLYLAKFFLENIQIPQYKKEL